MSRRTPPKRRHRERPERQRPNSTPQPNDDPRGYSAPGHMGGQFDEARYGSGHGAFGFTQHTLP